MPVYRARAEFRRANRTSRWVVAGVHLGGQFWPASPGVEPVWRRLPEPGLLGWIALDAPIVAADAATAATTALDMARSAWPDWAARPVPFADGEG